MSMIHIPDHKHKYNARKTEYRGIFYDSKSEANRAATLDLLMRAGAVAWWIRQPLIDLGEPGVDKPYRPDFLVAEPRTVPSGRILYAIHAEDVKGFETASFRRHVKQWKLRGPFQLHILTSKGVEIIEGGQK